MKIIFTAAFEQDLTRIYQYLVENFNETLAHGVMKNIRNDCAKIENEIGWHGKNYERNTEWKIITIQKRNKVFYKIEGDAVVIYAIFDSREDFWSYIE